MLNLHLQLHTLEVNGTSNEEVRNFVYNHLGEVRILGALRKHACIVEIFGQQLSSKWVPATEGKKEHRLLQSEIMMEFIKGGSLQVVLLLKYLVLLPFKKK